MQKFKTIYLTQIERKMIENNRLTRKQYQYIKGLSRRYHLEARKVRLELETNNSNFKYPDDLTKLEAIEIITRLKNSRKKMSKAEYQEYLKSDHWQDVRSRFRQSKLHNYGCYVCQSKGELHLHHKSYKRLFEERLNDFIYLCPAHHLEVHAVVEKHGNRSLWGAAKGIRKRYEKVQKRKNLRNE